jgi:ribonuclease HI
MAVSKKKFYAVVKGRKPGIYTQWFGPQGAQVQIDGVAGAIFKGFATRQEAQAFLEGREKPVARPASPPEPVWRKHTVAQAPAPRPQPDQVVIYTDGGCSHNPGPGGYGAVILDGENRRELSGGYRHTTNNRMELTACIMALQALDRPRSVRLFSDSRYVVNGITKGWAKRWRQNQWMRTKTAAAQNPDLWQQLLDLCQKHQVSFSWVRGHVGNPENERCDRLANAAMGQENLPADTGYRK